MEKLSMSARAFDRILRVARTIADLDYSQVLSVADAVAAPVRSRHIAEAIGYHALDCPDYGPTF